MVLDPKKLIAPNPQEYYVDKDTGLPLVGGTVTYYKDQNRTELKTVYKLSGSPPSYTYTALPNPLTLSAVGTTQDNTGNDVRVYYEPFDSAGAIELYYLEIRSSSGTLQETREAWPNTMISSASQDNELQNFVPNGQFLAHTDIPATSANNNTAGRISAAVTTIANGGWTFERPSGSTAIEFIRFHRYASPITIPTGNPRYAVELEIQTADISDAFQDIRLKFRDVNKFSSAINTYTLYFEGQNVTGGNISVNLYAIRNFGTGGSPSTQTEELLDTFTFTSSVQSFNSSFSLASQTGKVLGTNNDDFIQFAFRFPNQSIKPRITDVAFLNGTVVLAQFPPQPNSAQLDKSTAGWLPTPNPDGSDLFLPIRLTKSGLEYDNSEVGKIRITVEVTPSVAELVCDGTRFLYSGYSTDGIPYSRLGDKLWDSTNFVYRFGGGAQFFTFITPISSGVTDKFRITQNTKGAATAAQNGSASPGFTFRSPRIHDGSDYFGISYLVATSQFYIEGVFDGNSADTITPNTSGFTVAKIPNVASIFPSLRPNLYTVTTVAGAGLGGTYFNYDQRDGGAVQQLYYVWYNTGASVDPAPPGRTAIEIGILTTDTAADVAQKTSEALNGFQIDEVTTVAASSITAGDFIEVFAPNGDEYEIWYEKDGAGTAPGTVRQIKVAIDGTDTAQQVAEKTRTAVNQSYFALPNLPGQFLRIFDNGAGVDPDAASRYSLVPQYFGDKIGTFQSDTVQQHAHSVAVAAVTTTGGTDAMVGGAGTAYTGTGVELGKETRPINVSLNAFIKY